MLPKFLLFVLIWICVPARAETLVSAERQPGQKWEEALGRALDDQRAPPGAKSAWGLLTSEPAAVAVIPEWRHGFPQLERLFHAAKNARLYANPNGQAFRRKAAWYYLDDGCYSKAAHVSYVAANQGFEAPGKIYAFGNLRFHSRYARNGRTAYWSYHVAAAYRIGAQLYVVDPAVSSGPVTKTEWLTRIASHPARVELALCDARSYSPYSTCVGGKGNGAYLGDMGELLRMEWSNLSRLGYTPHSLLAP